ncbi:MAG: hypothetical protein V3T83_20590 [Acidobacteriota bacterium]
MRETLPVGEERTPAGKALDGVGSEAASLVEEAGNPAEMVYLKCGADGVRCRHLCATAEPSRA